MWIGYFFMPDPLLFVSSGNKLQEGKIWLLFSFLLFWFYIAPLSRSLLPSPPSPINWPESLSSSRWANEVWVYLCHGLFVRCILCSFAKHSCNWNEHYPKALSDKLRKKTGLVGLNATRQELASWLVRIVFYVLLVADVPLFISSDVKGKFRRLLCEILTYLQWGCKLF